MKKKAIAPIETGDIKSRMLVLRNQAVLLDRDINEFSDWKSKVLISITSAGHKLVDLIGENLSMQTVETEIELNLAVVKIRHKITKLVKK